MLNLSIEHLKTAYRNGTLTPMQLIQQLIPQLEQIDTHAVWISRFSAGQLLDLAAQLEQRLADTDLNSLPLYGIPFAVKDNIDLLGLPTTAGCADFAYQPTESATVVQRLIDAGAIPIGKTNLDQLRLASMAHGRRMALRVTASILTISRVVQAQVQPWRWRSVRSVLAWARIPQVRGACLRRLMVWSD